jgi:quercetin dioxygenase-like cupin family protein
MKKALRLTAWLLFAFSLPLVAQDSGVFPKGKVATVDNHTGTVWLTELSKSDEVFDFNVAQATFAPGAKLDWHIHPGGQILMITEGTGYYQEQGKAVQIVHKGDVIKCTPGVAHWHGAAPQGAFAYIAISPAQKGETKWLNRVTDEEYRNADRTSATSATDKQ